MPQTSENVNHPAPGNMLAAALDLLNKREFSILPVGRDKRPLIPWAEFQKRLPTEEEVTEWFTRWPDANVAVVTGAVSNLVVVDADGDAGLEWMKAHLPVTGVYVQTGKGWHGYYRHPGGTVGNRVRLAAEVDIRADGGYVVCPPSVHESGHVYTFDFPPGLRAWDDLALYELQNVPPVLAPGTGGVALDLSGVSILPSVAPVPVGQRNAALTQLVGQWLNQGMSADVVLFAADGWNRALPVPLPDAEVRRTTESILKADARNHPERGSAPVVEVVAPEPAPAGTGLPPELLNPGGLLGMLISYTVAASAVSHPVFALAGAIATVGTLIGQKMQTETGLRTNFYCIALGYSGAGKDSPQSAIPQVLLRSRASQCLGGDALTSDAALLRHLAVESQARALFMLDEIGLLLQALKRPNSHAADIPAVLMKLFTSADRGYSRRYSDPKNNIDIKWHHLSFYGASTPDRFWDSLTRGEATDGFLARCLVFESRHDVEPPKRRTETAVPEALLDAVNALHDMVTPLSGAGNLSMVPNPLVVPKAPEAERRFTQWAEKYHELRNKYLREDEGLSAIYGRAAEHAHKLALVHAASLSGPDTESVGEDSVTWACKLTDVLMSSMVRQIEGNLAENDFHKLTQRAMKIITAECRRKSDNSCPRWRITAGLKGATPRLINDVLVTLQTAGQICEAPAGSRGPSGVRYRLSKPVEDELETQENSRMHTVLSVST